MGPKAGEPEGKGVGGWRGPCASGAKALDALVGLGGQGLPQGQFKSQKPPGSRWDKPSRSQHPLLMIMSLPSPLSEAQALCTISFRPPNFLLGRLLFLLPSTL